MKRLKKPYENLCLCGQKELLQTQLENQKRFVVSFLHFSALSDHFIHLQSVMPTEQEAYDFFTRQWEPERQDEVPETLEPKQGSSTEVYCCKFVFCTQTLI
jgi:hypothetical protein